jgi:hypothetical protein
VKKIKIHQQLAELEQQGHSEQERTDAYYDYAENNEL